MTTTASAPSPAAPLSRLVRLGSGFGFKQQPQAGPSQRSRQYTDANDSEWYIPYNGPYEQPKEVTMGRVGDRDSWSDLVGGEHTYDPFERDRSALGHGGASTSGHGHGRGSSAQGHTFEPYYGEERERGRPFSPVSKYSDSHSMYGGGERRSQAVVSPVTTSNSPRRGPRSGPTFLNLDTSGVGIGESPVPAQRVGHSSLSGHSHDHHERSHSHSFPQHPPAFAPTPTVSSRESVGSFWTFGRSSNKKSPPIQAFGGRPSIERRSSATIRQSAAQTPMVMRERSATVAGQSGEQPFVQLLRPRANTAVPPEPTAAPPVLIPPISQYQYADEQAEANRATSPYERHPYAMASAPTGHRQHSRLVQSNVPKQDAQPRRTPTLNLPVPFLSSSKSFASLKKSTKSLKASVSTPNLRGGGSVLRVGQANGGSSAGSRSPPSSGGSKWLSAETWCDALLFPRPRFRMRAAHVISPPTSPLAGAPPFSAPPQTQTQPRSLKRSLLGSRDPLDVRKAIQVPSSAPPEFSTTSTGHPLPPLPSQPPAQPEAGPSQKTLRPPRPRSFAQDDLAIPSPVPSLATVIKQNEAFDKERDEWKSKASSSFANKRSRSLSRSRMKSKAKLTAESQSELVSSFDLIASSAFHGNQTVKPSIHFAQSPTVSGNRSGGGTNTTSTGLNTSSSHSRNTSSTSHGGTSAARNHEHGHSRKESWGKSALKTAKHTANATGLCGFTDDLSPADEKVMDLDSSPGRDQTVVFKLNGREKEGTNTNSVVIIAPHAIKPKSSNLDVNQYRAPGLSLTPVPSDQSGESTSHSGVGIALSTPTADQPFQFSDHPFANGTHQNDVMPRASDYAGPHPSRMAEFTLNESSLNDVSIRHRMPAAGSHSRTGSASLHPYAVPESQPRPSIQLPVSNIPSPSKMFAETGAGAIREIMPDEIQYSPYSSMYPGGSNRNSALGVEEALSMAFSHGRMDNAEYGEGFEAQKAEEGEEEEDLGYKSGAQELIAPPILRSGNHYHTRLMPQIDEVSVRESWQTSQDENNFGNFEAPTPLFYKASASPGQMSLDSSPMASPRQFKKFDDMEDYSDLFYRPGQQVPTGGNGSGIASAGLDRRTPSSDLVRALSREGSGGPERPMLNRSNSALTNLRKQLSEEYNAGIDERQILEGDVDLSRHISEVSEMDEDIDDAHAIFSQGSSPPGTTLPLRVDMNRPDSLGPAHMIPEDVESSRASSILERFETEDGTEIYYRLGEVPTLSTPDPVTSSNINRASAHGSYIEDTPRAQDRYQQSLSPVDYDPSGRDSRSRRNLKPPTSATTNSTTRASYMTSTSSASRISQLSDFPAPPGQNTLTPGAIIQSYFGSTPEATERADPLASKPSSSEQRREDRQSRRTTFGPVPFDSLDPA